MEGSEAVTLVFLVDPCDNLLRRLHLAVTEIEEGLEALDAVVECALMQQSLPVLVDDVANNKLWLLLQVGKHLDVVVVFDEGSALLVSFSQLGVGFACLHKLLDGCIALQVVSGLEGVLINLHFDRRRRHPCLPESVC